MAEPSAAHAKPAGHVSHEASPPALYVPATQATCSELLVLGHANPAGHGVQKAALPTEKVPGAQAAASTASVRRHA